MENIQSNGCSNKVNQVRENVENMKKRARQLLEAGYKPSEVAKELNVSVASLANWFRQTTQKKRDS